MSIMTSQLKAPWFGAQCARMLLAVNKANAEEACRQQWIANGWGPAVLHIFPTNDALPACIAGVGSGQIFAGISGTDSLSQVVSYANPVAIRLGGHLNELVNLTFYRWGKVAAKMIFEEDAGAGREVVLCGHSYGAAVAMAAAIWLELLQYPGKVKLVTFGCPKLGGAEIYKPLARVEVIQWIDHHDPIPALPPSEGEIGWPLKLLWRAVTYIILPSYRAAGHSYIMDANGIYWPGGPQPLTPTIVQIFGSSEFLSEQILDPVSHFLREYERRLSLWSYTVPAGLTITDARKVLIAAGPSSKFPQRPPNQFRDAVTFAQIVAEQRARTDAEAVLASRPWGDVSLFGEAPAMAYVPPQFASRKMKYAKGWCVAWENGIIATGDRSRCLSLAKALNHFLRRLQTMDGFSHTDFTEVLQIYVGEASAGGLGFKPDQLTILP